MKNINKIVTLVIFAGLMSLNSCETTELDITADPNALTPDQASVDFFLNSIQEDFVRQFEGDADFDAFDNWQSGGNTDGDGFHELGMELVRTAAYTGGSAQNYATGFAPSDFDDEWINAYRGILADIRAMTPLAEEADLTHHLGIAEFIEAYLMVTMVDFFGDVPFTEAIQGEQGNFNPNVDSGESIYAASLTLLDNAIANFRSTPAADPVTDFYYDNDYAQWELAANTLKMRIYLQTRLVDANAISNFNSIVNSGNFIQDTADDFEWSWAATSATQPDSRHPRYGINYQGPGSNDYQANWFMNLMDTTDDPRIRYYFYRQSDEVPGATGVPPNEETLNCSLQIAPQHYVDGGFTFCWLDNGYWGRDHGDPEGIPPDGLLRTAFGTYPIGGRFDDSSFGTVTATNGAGGTGVSTLLSAFNVDFMRAEVAMVQGNTGAARDFMLDGFDKQMAKVQAFLIGREAGADISFEPSAADIAAYRQTVSDNFDAADMNGKWDVLAEQYFIAHFGNGVDPYNFYRRTLFPTTLQPNREPNPGTFMNSLWYPANVVNRNASISQKSDQGVPVFWDNSGTPPAN